MLNAFTLLTYSGNRVFEAYLLTRFYEHGFEVLKTFHPNSVASANGLCSPWKRTFADRLVICTKGQKHARKVTHSNDAELRPCVRSQWRWRVHEDMNDMSFGESIEPVLCSKFKQICSNAANRSRKHVYWPIALKANHVLFRFSPSSCRYQYFCIATGKIFTNYFQHVNDTYLKKNENIEERQE